MEQDISPQLLRKVQKAYRAEVKNNPRIALLMTKVEHQNATYVDADELAFEYGDSLSKAFREITGEDLPDGRMYYNIADKTIRPMLEENLANVSDVCLSVQSGLNKSANIGLKAIKVPDYQGKIHDLIWKLSQYESFEEGQFLLGASVINQSKAVVTDSIRVNAEFQSRTGLSPRIIRKSNGFCCEWCEEMVGEYNYPDNIPGDVYRRHNNCSCTVDYYPRDGRVQNVHSKEWYKAESERTKEWYEERQKRVVNNEYSDIIKSLDIDDFDVKAEGRGIVRRKK